MPPYSFHQKRENAATLAFDYHLKTCDSRNALAAGLIGTVIHNVWILLQISFACNLCRNVGQTFHWKLNHKRICPTYNTHLASAEYQALPPHQQLDSILLSHTLAEMSLLPTPYLPEPDSPASVLLSLLPHPSESIDAPPVCQIKPPPPTLLANKLYARFGNNNFAIHSHLTTIGHGIFSLASRLFNHSCVPNAAAKYHFSPWARSVTMEVVALCDILPGEEVRLVATPSPNLNLPRDPDLSSLP